MTWTQFWDMNSGGGRKENWQHIFIEAPRDEATVVFYNRFGHNPERVSCTCCGEDYSIDEGESLALLTAHHRHCGNLVTPRDPVTRLYKQPQDPWFKEHYYLEPDEEAEARERGWEVEESTARKVGREMGSDYGAYLTLAEFIATSDVLVIRADEIKPEERKGEVPSQGYVWAG